MKNLEKDEINSREFLDFPEYKNNRVEELLKVEVNNCEIETVKQNEILEKKNEIPPWKREVINLDSSILERTKKFLLTCNKSENQRVISSEDSDKKVIMDVHLGVFDVNGKISDNNLLSNKDIIDVPIDDLNKISEFDDQDSHFLCESDEFNEDDKKIYKMLTEKNKDKNLVQVVSSLENE